MTCIYGLAMGTEGLPTLRLDFALHYVVSYAGVWKRQSRQWQTEYHFVYCNPEPEALRFSDLHVRLD